MSVEFSLGHGCWVWSCLFGHFGSDHEGEQEAVDAYLSHDCPYAGDAA